MLCLKIALVPMAVACMEVASWLQRPPAGLALRQAVQGAHSLTPPAFLPTPSPGGLTLETIHFSPNCKGFNMSPLLLGNTKSLVQGSIPTVLPLIPNMCIHGSLFSGILIVYTNFVLEPGQQKKKTETNKQKNLS